MAKVSELTIHPPILHFSRESKNLSKQDVLDHFSKKTKKSFKISTLTDLEKIERGQQPIGLTLMKELALLYSRPLSFFFLKAPPKDASYIPKDYRTLGSHKAGELSTKTILEVRKIRRAQYVYQQLKEEGVGKKPKSLARLELKDDPFQAAQDLRNILALTLESQVKMSDPSELFNFLRSKMEEFGILVYKCSFPLEDARAFSFVDQKPYLIIINNKDGSEFYTPKVFSLMHEFCHLLLRQDSICDNFNDSHTKIEKFCNIFASEFLVPANELQSDIKFGSTTESIKELKKELDSVRRKFKVSYEVILRKYILKGVIDDDYVKKALKIFFEGKAPQSTYVPLIKPQDKPFNSLGKSFVFDVVDAKKQNKISPEAASDALAIKMKYLKLVEARVNNGK